MRITRFAAGGEVSYGLVGTARAGAAAGGEVIAELAGYACALDVTAADLSERDGRWARAKGFDTFCPLGPWIETGAGDAGLELTTSVNGQVCQRAKVPPPGQHVAALVAAASNVMTLLPGDVLLAGVPGGGGGARLEQGDEVSVSIGAIGTLTNKVEHGD